MAQMKVEITGLSATLNNLDKEYKEFLRRTAIELKTELQNKTPVKSGNARKGWKDSVKGDKIQVSNSVDYIERLDKNHSPQTKGQGIVKPALDSFNRKKLK
jgi:fumarate hydratase class II